MIVDSGIRLARPLVDVPFIIESYEAIVNYYYASPEFVKVSNYPANIEIANRELGYLAIMNGMEIYPVVRIIVDRDVMK